MKQSRIIILTLLFIILAPGAAPAKDKPDSVLVKKIAALEERIRILEERVRVLEIEIAKLSDQLGVPPAMRRAMPDAWGKLTVGMTRAEVRHLLGEPDEIALHAYLEIWDYSRTYGAPCSVTFDEEGSVESWKAP